MQCQLIRTLLAIAAAITIVVTATPAQGQLLPSTGFNVQTIGTGTPFPGGEFVGTSDTVGGQTTFGWTGDMLLPFAIGEHRASETRGTQTFQTGLFPTLIAPEVSIDAKIGIAGGQINDPGTPNLHAFINLTIFETDGFDPFNPGVLSNPVYGSSHVFGSVSNNGFLQVTEQIELDQYVLIPDREYTFRCAVSMVAIDGDFSGAIPVGFLEAGGISDFDGISIALNQMPLPTPGTAVVAALGGLTVLRRRRV